MGNKTLYNVSFEESNGTKVFKTVEAKNRREISGYVRWLKKLGLTNIVYAVSE